MERKKRKRKKVEDQRRDKGPHPQPLSPRGEGSEMRSLLEEDGS